MLRLFPRAGTLVNDLDLTVTEPGGTIHHPMILDPSPGKCK